MYTIKGTIASRTVVGSGEYALDVIESKEVAELRTNWQGVLNWFESLKRPSDACITVFDERGRQIAMKDKGFKKLIKGEFFIAE